MEPIEVPSDMSREWIYVPGAGWVSCGSCTSGSGSASDSVMSVTPLRYIPNGDSPVVRSMEEERVRTVSEDVGLGDASGSSGGSSSSGGFSFIPHEKERENVEEVVGDDATIVFITTPGQLAALINDSAGVITTNTAAVKLANARDKPCIALFGSEEKANRFVPNAEQKNCVIVSSKTTKLKDIDIEAVRNALPMFNMSLALV